MSLSSELGAIKNKIETVDRQISEKQTLILQKNQLSIDIDAYSKLSKAFGKDGIQAIIMENITEDLKNFSNNFLSIMSSDNMSIDFITQTKTTTGNWKEDFEIIITMDGSVREFDDLSGGEQVRVAMAIRLAIGQLLMQRVGSDIRFLLLDEVDQALDAYGIEALSDAVQALAKDFKILVITHNEAIKEKFSHVITVVKQPTGSIIR
jgi:exonuclease SbcC